MISHWNKRQYPGAASAKMPWWLFPNALALDAPAVAICWQLFLGRAFQILIPFPVTFALGMVVWSIYLFDRISDIQGMCPATPRHQFASRHPLLMRWMLGLGVTGAWAGIALIPYSYLIIGICMGAGVVLYLWLVHSRHGTRAWVRHCKEALVGGGFAAGVALPLAQSELPAISWLPSAAWFATLCWMNCRLIDCWENRVSLARQELALFGCLCLLFASFSPARILLPGILTIALLALVHFALGKQNTRLARVLVDVALLSPLAFW